MRRVRIIIKISRYQQEKRLGDLWRVEGDIGETFTEFRRRKLKELKK